MKAVGMFSGGLDSILSARIMKEEGFEVLALHCYNGFNGSVRRELAEGPDRTWMPEPSILNAAARLGITLVPVDVSREFTPLLLHPPHGWGTGANPCIDCHVFFARKAKEVMEREGAAFVFSGEVVGQRPMSQHTPILKHVEKASGLDGRLLRPLSAKRLEETVPEREGLINRDHLYGFHGRSRKPQLELAKRFGIDFYPQSGGGCLLTERGFGIKFRDLVKNIPGREPSRAELHSLKTGRHLRLRPGLKIVIGRNEAENGYLQALLRETAWWFTIPDVPGAEVFALGDPTDEESRLIAAITARYSKSKNDERVTVQREKEKKISYITVQPAQQEDIDRLMLF